MKLKPSDLCRWDGTIGRGPYLFWGLVLGLVKVQLDRVIGSLAFGRPLSGWGHLRFYLWPTLPAREDLDYDLVLLATSLPFLWAGVVLTVRRLRCLGWRPGWVLLFLAPVLKLFFFGALCVLPGRGEGGRAPDGPGAGREGMGRFIPRSGLGSALMAVAISVGGTLLLVWLGTSALGDYGGALFVGLPFSMGFLAVLIDSHHEPRGFLRCLGVANAAVLLAGLGLLLVAIEGAICLLMAAPIALALASIGGMVGYAIQKTVHRGSTGLYCVAFLGAPAVMGLEHWAPPPLPLLAVSTPVVIHAPPEVVWRHVVSFSTLPPPREWLFRLGIAYPVTAEIRGSGPGAVRHCRFSTGPFVEPIQTWDEPRLLRFTVEANPEPMQEWTPYRTVHPRHLKGYLESREGQFRLEALEGGRTLLIGTTWYQHHMWPARYWQLWSDLIIHTIHRRVLNHVKALSEGGGP